MTIKIPLFPVLGLIAAGTVISGVFLFAGKGSQRDDTSATNVSIKDGAQVIEIRAKGGYQPRKSRAKAGMPTTLRFNTIGTFDCSAAVNIPSLAISKILPPSGVTDISIGMPSAGKLKGSCSMGMYPFEVEFGS